MRGDLIETFKIINGISNYGRHFLNISPQTGNLLSRHISRMKSINQLIFFFFFFANRVIYSLNKLPNQIKSNHVKNSMIELVDFRNNGKKKK